jgi:hypothetical protein
MMSNGGSGKTESVIPFEPKLNLRSEAADPLDAAGQTILDVLRQAAAAAEANNQQAREVAHKLSAQVLAAEDRIREFKRFSIMSFQSAAALLRSAALT